MGYAKVHIIYMYLYLISKSGNMFKKEGWNLKLTHFILLGQSNELLVFCNKMAASEALESGLVSHVYTESEFKAESWKRIKEMTSLPVNVSQRTFMLFILNIFIVFVYSVRMILIMICNDSDWMFQCYYSSHSFTRRNLFEAESENYSIRSIVRNKRDSTWLQQYLWRKNLLSVLVCRNKQAISLMGQLMLKIKYFSYNGLDVGYS